MLRSSLFSTVQRATATATTSSSSAAMSTSSVASVGALVAATRGKKFVNMPTPDWDAEHEDLNAHVKKRLPGETRDERSRRFAREWRNVELELGIHKDSRGRELRYRKSYVYRYTYPNTFDDHWAPQR